uniref:Transposase n=1 Tax=Angiostrongylus cantonensis TaxID=6313 RepID=A0A158PBU9_ANGCA
MFMIERQRSAELRLINTKTGQNRLQHFGRTDRSVSSVAAIRGKTAISGFPKFELIGMKFVG